MNYESINSHYSHAKNALLDLELKKEKWETRRTMIEEKQQKAICEAQVTPTLQNNRAVEKNDATLNQIEETINALELKIEDQKKVVDQWENRLIQASPELTQTKK